MSDPKYTTNIHGGQVQVGEGNTQNNFMDSASSDEETYKQLIQTIRSLRLDSEKQKDILEYIEEMRKAQNKQSFMDAYNKLDAYTKILGITADHIAVITAIAQGISWFN